eukprot:gene3330-6591_t
MFSVEPKTPIEIEKEMFKIKREMGAYYSKGSYENALQSATHLQIYVEETMGKDNAIYASCLNNVALMNKMLGNYELAVDKYIDALHKYEDVSGKFNSSYISTLTNLGVLCKTFAEHRKGKERTELLQRADEALYDAYKLRTQVSGFENRDTLFVANHLACLWRTQGDVARAERKFRETLEQCRLLFGDKDSLTATVLNNLGFLLKTKGGSAMEEAQSCYDEALSIRSGSLGDKHPDTIVTMHNLSELLYSKGDQEGALVWQNRIVALLDTAASPTAHIHTHTHTHTDHFHPANPVENKSDPDPVDEWRPS